MLSIWHLFFKLLGYILLLQANYYLDFHESTLMYLRTHNRVIKYGKILKTHRTCCVKIKKACINAERLQQRFYAISNIIRYALAWQFMKASEAMFISPQYGPVQCTLYKVECIHLFCNTHAKLHLKYEYCTLIRIVVILLLLFHICIN